MQLPISMLFNCKAVTVAVMGVAFLPRHLPLAAGFSGKPAAFPMESANVNTGASWAKVSAVEIGDPLRGAGAMGM